MQCPNCRSLLLRAAALRCWKCGHDLTRPVEAPAATAAAGPTVVADVAGRGVLTPGDIPALEPEFAPSTDAPGRAPHNWFVRTFDPRIDGGELARAAHSYPVLPWIESYRKLAGLALLPLAVVLQVIGRAVRWMITAAILPLSAHADLADPWWFHLPDILFWGTIGVLVAAWFVYRGSRLAMAFAGLAWITALGLPLLAPIPALARMPLAGGLALVVLYVQLVALWKAVCVEFAHEDLVRRMRPAPGA